VWPEAVERIAELLRGSGVEGRLEELSAGGGPPPGRQVRVDTFAGDRGVVVALLPAGRGLDERKLAKATGRGGLLPAAPAEFPFKGVRVLIDQSLLSLDALWLRVGSPRHVLGLSPAQIAQVTKAESADLLREG
jgi:prolyl-tRNA editing enzyme YbaK/EbsC (Cys-tRNA(Pro) deacylase)